MNPVASSRGLVVRQKPAPITDRARATVDYTSAGARIMWKCRILSAARWWKFRRNWQVRAGSQYGNREIQRLSAGADFGQAAAGECGPVGDPVNFVVSGSPARNTRDDAYSEEIKNFRMKKYNVLVDARARNKRKEEKRDCLKGGWSGGRRVL